MSAGRNTSAPSLCYYPCPISSFLGVSLLFSALIDRSRVHLDRFLYGLNQLDRFLYGLNHLDRFLYGLNHLEFGQHVLKLHGIRSRRREVVVYGRTDRRNEANSRFSQLFCESAYKLMNELSLTLRLLISYIYGAPSKARNANVVYIWTYVWQR